MSSVPTFTRVALVTGGAQGIGRAIALHLAADGLDVAVDDIPSETQRLEEVVAEIKKMGRKAIAITCDVRKEDEVKGMVEQTVAELGRLDVVQSLDFCRRTLISTSSDDCQCWNLQLCEYHRGLFNPL